MLKSVTVAGINFNNLKMEELLELLNDRIKNKQKTIITPVNVDCIVKTNESRWYWNFISKSDYVLADGMPIVWISKLSGKPLKQRITGADLLLEISKISSRYNWKIFLYGSGEGVGKRAMDNLNCMHKNENVVGAHSPPYRDLNPDEGEDEIQLINSYRPDVIFVGLGALKQERWIEHNVDKINACVFVSCGASFDFAAGVKKRAPKLFRKVGMEWLWRAFSEPRRLLKRYFIDDMKFLPILFKRMNSKFQ